MNWQEASAKMEKNGTPANVMGYCMIAFDLAKPVWTQADLLPESDTTVLICMPDSDNPVDVGFHDGEAWFDYNGAPLTGKAVVSYWMLLPEPK